VLGEARLDLSAFLDSKTKVVSTAVEFLVKPKMWSEKGHFLALQDQAVPSVGTAYIKVYLHDRPAPPPSSEAEQQQ